MHLGYPQSFIASLVLISSLHLSCSSVTTFPTRSIRDLLTPSFWWSGCCDGAFHLDHVYNPLLRKHHTLLPGYNVNKVRGKSSGPTFVISLWGFVSDDLFTTSYQNEMTKAKVWVNFSLDLSSKNQDNHDVYNPTKWSYSSLVSCCHNVSHNESDGKINDLFVSSPSTLELIR